MLFIVLYHICNYFSMSKQYAVLVKEVQGHKELEVSSDTDYPLSYENIDISAGSLVKRLSPADVLAIRTAYKFKVNYSVYSSSSHDQSGVLLFASSDQLYELTKKQKDLLLAVDLVIDRVEVLKKFPWVESLEIGSKVYTTIDTIPVPVKGEIKYIGLLSSVEGIRFGIELIVRLHVFSKYVCMQLF